MRNRLKTDADIRLWIGILFPASHCYTALSATPSISTASRKLEDVRREVSNCVDILGVDGAGYICSCHNIQAGTPLENIVSMIETAQLASMPGQAESFFDVPGAGGALV